MEVQPKNSDKLTIGCHLSSSKGYLAMAETAVSIDANTFQFFTRNPRGGKAKALNVTDIEAFHGFASEQGISVILAHAPYTLNPASSTERVREFAFEVTSDDLVRMEATPGQLYNFHPGSHNKEGLEVGINRIIDFLNTVIKEEQTTTVLLETMTGKGSEIGGRFEELSAILNHIDRKNHMGVCLDTCHVWDAGYDIVGDLEGVLHAFDSCIGLEYLKAIHLNDSLNERGSRKDRHAKIGEGTIGFEALAAVMNHPLLRELPFYLETPNDLDGYAQEITELRAAYH